jgi:hypothetical protein
MVRRDLKRFVLAATIAAIGVFYFSTIREGHDWGSDFCQYIQYARNIVEHHDYKKINYKYLYDPEFTQKTPRAAPPVFPMLLAPVYRYWGLDLRAMKIEVIGFFLGFLCILAGMLQDRLRFRYVLSMVILLGFNPLFWVFKDQILTDLPFLFFAYLSLWMTKRLYGTFASPRRQSFFAGLVGFCFYLAYGTRRAGLLLPLSFLVSESMKPALPKKCLVWTVLSFLAFAIPQGVFLNESHRPFFSFAADTEAVLENLRSGYQILRNLWGTGNEVWISRGVFLSALALSLAGFFWNLKTEPVLFKIFRVFFVFYLGTVFVLSSTTARYFFPVLPIYLFYLLRGIERIGLWKRQIGKALFVLFIGVALVSYARSYFHFDYGPMTWGVGKKESVELFDYLQKHTDPNDIFIFRKPPVLALFAQRQASAYQDPADDRFLWDYFRKIRATHIIVGRVFKDDQRRLAPFVAQYPNDLERVFSNTDFNVYRIRSYPAWDLIGRRHPAV